MSITSIKKQGAGLLVVCEGEVLLLLRSPSCGNPLTWGLPGGNVDEGETPIDAARREATEEMGDTLPPYTIRSEIRTLRGKHRQKLFTVFVATIPSEDKANFRPRLNKEHLEYRWYPLNAIPEIPALHPVIQKIFEEHRQELDNALKP